MKRLMVAGALLAVAFALSLNMSRAADDEKPKHTIKAVMKACMKGDLCKKVGSGKASAEEKAQLVEMFVALSKNTPPKGEADSWKEKTGALVNAARDIKDGKQGSEDALKKAANCMGCHKAHKK